MKKMEAFHSPASRWQLPHIMFAHTDFNVKKGAPRVTFVILIEFSMEVIESIVLLQQNPLTRLSIRIHYQTRIKKKKPGILSIKGKNSSKEHLSQKRFSGNFINKAYLRDLPTFHMALGSLISVLVCLSLKCQQASNHQPILVTEGKHYKILFKPVRCYNDLQFIQE